MPSDDILDLIGRYATGSLTAEEQKRLFDAALDDQELFEQLVREQDMKQLLDQPGARDRMIRALEPPRRKTGWIFGVAATVALSVALVAFLLRPAPKPAEQVAVAKIPAPTEIAQPEPKAAAVPSPQPATAAPPPPPPAAAAPSPQPEVREEARRADAAAAPKPVTPVSQPISEPLRDKQKQLDAVKKEKDQSAPAAPPVPQLARASASRFQGIQPLVSQQQNSPGGPRQNNAEQARSGAVSGYAGGAAGKAQDAKTGAFGFHYSVEIQGHLSIIPAADGYLYVKSNDGNVLFGPKLSAAGIIVDLPLASRVTSVVITFSEQAGAVQTNPTLRTDAVGTVEATPANASAVAVEIRIKP